MDEATREREKMYPSDMIYFAFMAELIKEFPRWGVLCLWIHFARHRWEILFGDSFSCYRTRSRLNVASRHHELIDLGTNCVLIWCLDLTSETAELS